LCGFDRRRKRDRRKISAIFSVFGYVSKALVAMAPKSNFLTFVGKKLGQCGPPCTGAHHSNFTGHNRFGLPLLAKQLAAPEDCASTGRIIHRPLPLRPLLPFRPDARARPLVLLRQDRSSARLEYSGR